MIDKINFYNYVANYIQANNYEIIDNYLMDLDLDNFSSLSDEELEKLYLKREQVCFSLVEEICEFIKIEANNNDD